MANYEFRVEPQEVARVETQYRSICTDIPAPGTVEIIESLKKYESRSMHGQLPLVWDKAEGAEVSDVAGNRWIDFTSSIFVTNVGHSNARVMASVQAQMKESLWHTYAYSNKIRAEYLKELVEMSPASLEKVFLLSAGTESTDAALKLMRMYGQKQGRKKLGVVAIEGNWHGRTMGAQLLSNNPEQKAWIGFDDPDIHHLPFPYPWTLEGRSGREFFEESIRDLESCGVDLAHDLCGVMLETFQGWGAVFYPKDYVEAFEEFCRANEHLFAFDEMQAGFARTGKMFGFEHYDVQPDLVCVGKGMASGFPLSGVLGRKEIMDLPSVGNMSSTHSANPICCAAGLATLKEISSRGLVERSRMLGEVLHKELEAIRERWSDQISTVLGKGMIAALIFKNSKGEPESLLPSKVAEKCFQKGLLVVHTGRESIKIGPPLVILEDALLEGLRVIEEALEESLS